jgi:E3 ubiquitin-protein ligase UBR4
MHYRNINYEHLDGFMCNECGHSRYGRFEFTLAATPATAYAPLTSGDDFAIAMHALDAEAENLHGKRAALAGLHKCDSSQVLCGVACDSNTAHHCFYR